MTTTDTAPAFRIERIYGYPAGADIRNPDLQCPNPCDTWIVVSGYTVSNLDTFESTPIAQCAFCDFTDFNDLYLWQVERMCIDVVKDPNHLTHATLNEITYNPPTLAGTHPRQGSMTCITHYADRCPAGCFTVRMCTCNLPSAVDTEDGHIDGTLIIPTHRCATCHCLLYAENPPEHLDDHRPQDNPTTHHQVRH